MLMPIFANPYPKAHEKESPIKIKAQRPTKKTKEQERSKERIQICRSKMQICSKLQICNRIQICRRIQFFGKIASADKDKLGLRPF